MPKAFRVLLIVTIVLVNPITGFIFGRFGVAEGIFIKWVALGKPPEMPVKILAADVGNIGIYVRTISGQIYSYGFGDNSSVWTKRTESEVHGYNFPDCLMGNKAPGKHIRNEVDYYPVYWCGEWGGGHAYYAIRTDGSVWVWKISDFFPDGLIPICGYPLAGLLITILCVLALVTAKKQEPKSVKMQRAPNTGFLSGTPRKGCVPFAPFGYAVRGTLCGQPIRWVFPCKIKLSRSAL
jgi:hypothetical protein